MWALDDSIITLMQSDGDKLAKQLTEDDDLLAYTFNLLAHTKTCLMACQFIEDLLQARRNVLNLHSIRMYIKRYLYPHPTKLVVGHLVGPSICRRHGMDYNSSLLLNFNFKFHIDVVFGYGQKPIDFQRCHFQNGCLVAILDF